MLNEINLMLNNIVGYYQCVDIISSHAKEIESYSVADASESTGEENIEAEGRKWKLNLQPVAKILEILYLNWASMKCS